MQPHQVAMQDQRREASVQIAEDRQFALADLPDQRFEALVQRMQKGLERARTLLKTALIENAHYGNPELKGGRKAFGKPVLYQSGARELRRVFKLRIVQTDTPDERIITPDFVSVTVERAIVDAFGNELDRVSRSCTSKERRFKAFSDKRDWTYDDPREVLNDCLAMAEKRAAVALTVSATGMDTLLSAEEVVDEAVAERAMVPWTEEEKRRVYQAATQAGIGKVAFGELVVATLGRGDVGTGADVAKLLEAIAAKSAAAEAAE